MVPDSAVAAAERTEAARRLIDEAGDAGIVELVTVSGLELCTLGGPKHPLFEAPIAQAWERLGNRRRKKVIEWVTDGMVRRTLLTKNNPASPAHGDGTYSPKPELGIALAARCRPAFIVITETAVSDLRTPRFFGLGDQGEPVRGIVAEEPTALPAEVAGDFPHVKKLGPLGWFYRYALFSPGKAAAALAAWAIAPPPQRPAIDPRSARVVSLYRRWGGMKPEGVRLRVRGDGLKARVEGPESGESASAEYDREALQAVMLDLLTVPPR